MNFVSHLKTIFTHATESVRPINASIRDQRGSVALMFALMLPIIFGIIGLGVEVGIWFKDRRELQTIADAAAVSAAIENAYGATQAEIEAAAQMEATTNGFDAATDDITYVGVPTQGAFNGQAGYIEVIITRQLETILSQVFSSLDPTTMVRAVASTGNASSGEACVLALDTTGAAVTVTGNGAVTLTNCQVASNSTADDALSVSGSGGLDVDCYSVVGNVDVTAGLTTAAGCAGATGAAAIADPYAALDDPDDGNCDEPGNFEWNSVGSTTIGNGSWSDPYVICGDFWAKKGTVTFNGLVVVKGDFKANATATIDSAVNGTTVVLKDGGQINNINGGAAVTLTAPSSEALADEWQGILFYQDRDTSPSCTGNNCNTLNGNGSTQFEGVVYFPNQELDILGGNSSTSACLQIVALRVGFSGNGAMNADNDCMDAGVDPIEVPGAYTSLLVE